MNTRYWNLRSNKFESIDESVALSSAYQAVKTLDGNVVYIKTVADLYTKALDKANEVTRSLAKQMLALMKGADIVSADLDRMTSDGQVDSIISGLRFNHVLVELFVEQEFNIGLYEPTVDYLSDLYWKRDVEIPSRLSKKYCKMVRKEFQTASLSELCEIYGINHTFASLDVRDVVRIYVKAFVKEGVGFVLARIISKDGVTVAREGVCESVSPEYAELVLLDRVSRVASNTDTRVEVITGNLNVVNWLEGANETFTHSELRKTILKWLKPLGYSARKMTDDENAAYREEKRGGS